MVEKPCSFGTHYCGRMSTGFLSQGVGFTGRKVAVEYGSCLVARLMQRTKYYGEQKWQHTLELFGVIILAGFNHRFLEMT